MIRGFFAQAYARWDENFERLRYPVLNKGKQLPAAPVVAGIDPTEIMDKQKVC